MLLVALFGVCLLKSVVVCEEPKPNILYIMADDLGWNDVSWHDSEMQTPVLEQLAHNNAALLENSYVNQACTITRSAFLTGKYPFMIGTQSSVFAPMEPTGVPTNMPFFTDLLKEKGYKTYMIGKWHLGHCKSAYLPTNRGFDKYLGFLNGGQDYYTHMTEARNGAIKGFDFWLQDAPAYSYQGQYSTEIFATETKNWLSAHDKSVPFFFYLSFQAVRYPLQVPEKYLESCKQQNEDRRTYCGMLYALDSAVGQVVEFLKENDLYDNTVIIFSTDNGGNTLHGGNNWPYRGNKGTLWEGGTHAVNFVHSPKYITNPGSRYQLFHVVDWFSTFMHLAGSQENNYEDSMNQWDMISTGKQDIERASFVYNIADQGSAISAGMPSTWVKSDGSKVYGRINRQTMKLKELFYDLEADPYELNNLASDPSYGSLITEMRAMLEGLKDNEHPSIHEQSDPRGNPKNYNGTFASGWC